MRHRSIREWVLGTTSPPLVPALFMVITAIRNIKSISLITFQICRRSKIQFQRSAERNRSFFRCAIYYVYISFDASSFLSLPVSFCCQSIKTWPCLFFLRSKIKVPCLRSQLRWLKTIKLSEFSFTNLTPENLSEWSFYMEIWKRSPFHS